MRLIPPDTLAFGPQDGYLYISIGDHYILGFGQDRKGEVYVLTTDNEAPTGHTGKVYKMY